MTMSRKRVMELLNNPHFVNVLTTHRNAFNEYKKLKSIKETLFESGITEIDQLADKIEELRKTTDGYDKFIHETFGVTWHWHQRLHQYIDNEDIRFDDTTCFPEHIKP